MEKEGKTFGSYILLIICFLPKIFSAQIDINLIQHILLAHYVLVSDFPSKFPWMKFYIHMAFFANNKLSSSIIKTQLNGRA